MRGGNFYKTPQHYDSTFEPTDELVGPQDVSAPLILGISSGWVSPIKVENTQPTQPGFLDYISSLDHFLSHRVSEVKYVFFKDAVFLNQPEKETPTTLLPSLPNLPNHTTIHFPISG